VTGSGVGIWNTQPSYAKFIVQNNNFYNNKNGQIYGSGFTMSNNLNVDPQRADQTNTDVGSRDSNIGRYGSTAQASRNGTTVSNLLDYPPVPNVVLDMNASQNLTVSFNASSSTDDIGIVSYSWDFDASNGITSDATGITVTNTYAKAGNYTVTLTVTDTSGQRSSKTLQLSISNSSISVISSETSNGTGNETSYDIDDEPVYDTLFPVHENRLRASLADRVLSNSTYIDVGKRSSESRDVMLFNLSMYNTTDIISNATLYLYWYYPANTTRMNDTIVEIYRPFAWDPEYVNWNRQNSNTSWLTPGGNWFDHNGTVQGSNPYASLTFAAGNVSYNRYYELDVTDLVQEYISGKYNNTGLFIKARNESGNYIAFYSSEWHNESQRPKLTITVDRPPIANAGPDITTIAGTNTTFNGSLSSDDNGNVSYSWDFDASDGITSEAATMTATKIYPSAGNYTATLTVTDSRGQTSSDTVEVFVRKPLVSTSYTAAYDNRLRESSAGKVLSTSGYIDIGKSAYRCRDVMWFNLSSYNTTDMIYNATLSLYWYYPENNTRKTDTIVEIYRPVEWDPEYVSWNFRHLDTPWDTKGGNWFDRNNMSQGRMPYASLTFEANNTPDNRYYDLNVTDLVQEYVSGKYNNTGFFLKARNENGDYIAFYGSEWSNTSQRPKLTVTC
ncbi:MAG: disaggregatase related repeat-containing protein, partial [Methanomethylovorans sp.]|uniref:disaggregatase related repeat-containing protein n=1 Tax=Methanomethylovorans sp. TaxID=2758717 RepID=UPI003C7236D6